MAFDVGGPIEIALVNEATTDPGVDLAALVRALNTQVHRDFAPAWGVPAIVSLEAAVKPGQWGLVLLDDADQAGVLGYHELTADGLPLGKVFVETTVGDGQLVSVTTSHELLELLVDPGVQMCAQGSGGSFYAYEVADAVEEATYLIGGVAVSDFVTPAWFEGFRRPGSTKFSFLGSVDAPFTLAPGGYISIFKGNRWTQVFGSELAQSRFNPKRKHRAIRRGL